MSTQAEDVDSNSDSDLSPRFRDDIDIADEDRNYNDTISQIPEDDPNGSRSGNNINNSSIQESSSTLEKRKTIQALINDKTINERDRRIRIQQLMDGSNRNSLCNQHPQQEHQRIQTSFPLDLINSLQSLESNSRSVSVVPCEHYERKCNIVAPCCGRIYGCRVCHDELTKKEHGPLIRYDIKYIVCKECGTRQVTSNKCIGVNCGVIFGEYHCNICNLWMEGRKSPFHCADCGFCRVGGGANFKHCTGCGMCISADSFETHKCLKDKYKSECPVCREDLFTSRREPTDLICGHVIHKECLRKLAAFDYRCPICKRSAFSHESMAAAWQQRALDIERQPMPIDLAKKVDISCNDCREKSANLAWHFLGTQCPHCQSFNTKVQ